MAANVTTEEVVLKVNQQVAGPLSTANAAISQFESQIASGADALREMEAKMRLIQSATSVDVAAFQELSGAIATQKASLAETQAAYVALGGSAQSALSIAKGGVDALTAAAEKQGAAAKAMAARVAAAQAGQAAKLEMEAVRHASRMAKTAAEAAAADNAARNQALAQLITAQATADRAAENEAQRHANKMAALAMEEAIARANAAKGANEQAKATAAGGQSAQNAAPMFEALAGILPILGGSMGGAAAQGVNLVKFLTKLPPVVSVALVAIIAIVGAVATFVAAVVKGITASGQMRDELLRLQGAAGGSASIARELQESIASVSSASALSRDKIEGYAVSLQKAKLSGGELKRALEAMAIAGSAGGESAAAAFLKTVEGAKASGQSVDELSAKVKKQLGGVAAAQALSLGLQFDKLSEKVNALFSGADFEPLLKAIAITFGLLDETSDSGKALKSIITDMVNAAILGLLKAATAALNLYTAIRTNETAWLAARATVWSLVIVFGALLAIVALLVAAFVILSVILALPFIAAVAVVMYLYDACVALYDGIVGIDWGAIGTAIAAPFVAAWNWITGLDFAATGTAIVDGIANGITSAIGSVVAAMTSLGTAAMSAFDAIFDFGSPSKVMKKKGRYIGEGTEIGVDDSRPALAKAMASLASPDQVKMSAPPGRPGNVGPRGVIQKLVILVSSRDEAQSTYEQLAEIFEIEEFDGAPA